MLLEKDKNLSDDVKNKLENSNGQSNPILIFYETNSY
jgi:hypothetical protein